MTYRIQQSPMMDFTRDGLDDYTLIGYGRHAAFRDQPGYRGWAVRTLNASYAGGHRMTEYGMTVVEAISVLVRQTGDEPHTIAFDPADHLVAPDVLPETEADDAPALPAWVAQRILYDPDEFTDYWINRATYVLDGDDRVDAGARVRRRQWNDITIERPDGSSDRLTKGEAVLADFVIRRVPNAIAMIADPANAPDKQDG